MPGLALKVIEHFPIHTIFGTFVSELHVLMHCDTLFPNSAITFTWLPCLGGRFSVVVTDWTRSTLLLYARPS